MLFQTLTWTLLSGVGSVLAAEHPTPLNITALSSRHGYSVLECWQLASVPVDAMSAANYAIGDTTKATWSRIEPRTYIGEAWAPHVQLSMILNGLIRIISPAPPAAMLNDSVGSMPLPTLDEIQGSEVGSRPETKIAYIMPGTLKSSLLIAADLKSVSTLAGHMTDFPSGEPTILVQVPFEGDKAPEHKVLHEGPCL